MPLFEHSKECLTAKAQELVEQHRRNQVITIGRLWEIVDAVAKNEVTNCPSEDEMDVSCYFCGGQEITEEG